MRFTVRSLWGKLVISAALMLLLCMLLFSITSWFVLKSFYEHQARSDARIHLVIIMISLVVFIIALGVTCYALVARTFFVRPIRRLQDKVAALVADNGDTELAASTIDELAMLSRSFSLLSESLSTQENESEVITRQMSDLLAMSDVLISTL
ncbi:MAG TPA: hypothetical protein VE843_14710, partial [Ktedonobacteraceae bacterium]|nr:hypothetical protein [Ktedonobacteraceae bacterium]